MDKRSLKIGVEIPEILLPNEKINMRKWAVVACDQFTSDGGYWAEVERTVGNAPSTLHMILPEYYLGDNDVEDRIAFANDTMGKYLNAGILESLDKGFILVEREVGGAVRRGLMAAVDLDAYDYDRSALPLIRATEDTLLERIPPRVKIRENAPVELPHVLVLMDDPEDSVIGTLTRAKAELQEVYNFELMQEGGNIAGYYCPSPELNEAVMAAIEALPLREGMRFCVGDGNHSLATAKTVWENAKLTMSEEEQAVSPLRYALAELVNIRDEAMTVMPIHRAISHVSPTTCIQRICDILNERGLKAKLMYTRRTQKMTEKDPYTIFVKTKQTLGRIEITNPSLPLAVGDLQPALEQYLKETPCAQIEYLHGDSQFEEFANMYDTVAFYMPDVDKAGFFDMVIDCGVLPKKTFSLGEANEKRYYIECRLIAPEKVEEED